MKYAFVWLLFLGATSLLGGRSSWAQTRCDDPEADAWVTEMRDRVVSFDPIVAFAVEAYGPISNCHGTVTAEFDAMEFGTVEFDFSDGATYRLETMPPEMSVTTLADSSGFKDEPAIRELLEGYTSEIGLSVDWTSPEVETNGDVRVETYWDPDDGMNASARLVYSNDNLISLRISLAL